MIRKIVNGKLILRERIAEDLSIYIEDGSITAVTGEALPADRELDAGGLYVSPGFIELHAHGGGGFDFMDGTAEAVRGAARLHLRHGTTTIFPTTMAAEQADTAAALASIRAVMKEQASDLPRIGGAHIEGPYFSSGQAGAQPPRLITPPKPEDYQALLFEFGSVIRRWSYAPELPGSDAFLKALNEAGVVASAAHTDAEYSHMAEAFQNGCQLITHLYSATSTITRHGGFRRLGVIETAFLYDDMYVEVIADGCHLPPELLQLIFKIKGADRICLVTDAMRCAGTNETQSFIGSRKSGTPCVVEDGVAKTLDKTAFAGSVATADRLVRTCVKQAGISLPEAVRMMTETPARVMGLSDRGRLASGCTADLVFFDADIQIHRVYRAGEPVLCET